MGVETTASYLVTAWLCHCGTTKSAEQWTYHQHRTAKSGTLHHKPITVEILQIEIGRLERIFSFTKLSDLHTYIYEQLNEIIDIEDIRNVVYRNLIISEQCGTYYLQGFILCALWSNGSAQRMTAFNDKCIHDDYFFFFFLLLVCCCCIDLTSILSNLKL